MQKHSMTKADRIQAVRQHKWLLPFVAFELASELIAFTDIWRHNQHLSTTKRVGWSALTLVQPVGPWLYYLFGRNK